MVVSPHNMVFRNEKVTKDARIIRSNRCRFKGKTAAAGGPRGLYILILEQQVGLLALVLKLTIG